MLQPKRTAQATLHHRCSGRSAPVVNLVRRSAKPGGAACGCNRPPCPACAAGLVIGPWPPAKRTSEEAPSRRVSLSASTTTAPGAAAGPEARPLPVGGPLEPGATGPRPSSRRPASGLARLGGASPRRRAASRWDGTSTDGTVEGQVPDLPPGRAGLRHAPADRRAARGGREGTSGRPRGTWCAGSAATRTSGSGVQAGPDRRRGRHAAEVTVADLPARRTPAPTSTPGIVTMCPFPGGPSSSPSRVPPPQYRARPSKGRRW